MPNMLQRFFMCCTIVFVVVLGSSAAQLGADETFEPVIEITPDEPGIGDALMLNLSIDVPSRLLVNFPRLGASLGRFAVTGQRAMEAEAPADGRRAWVQQYRLEPESTGDLVIPPLTIVVQDPDTLDMVEIVTVETMVAITSTVPADADLRQVKDILPPVGLAAETGGPGVWLLASGLALAALLLAFRWLRRGPRPEPIPESERPAHLIALEALDDLRAEARSGGEGSERFHIRLAAVLRRYLQDGYSVAAPPKTTEEILQETRFAESPLNAAQALIEKPLGQCDLVKFARYRPSDEAMSAALDDVAAFVRRTSSLEPRAGEHADAD